MPIIQEKNLIIPTVVLLSRELDGFLTTSQLIDKLEQYFHPVGIDARILRNRNDTHFSQKVRNMVCHRDARTGLQARGLAVYIKQRSGWQITDVGRDYIKQFKAAA